MRQSSCVPPCRRAASYSRDKPAQHSARWPICRRCPPSSWPLRTRPPRLHLAPTSVMYLTLHHGIDRHRGIRFTPSPSAPVRGTYLSLSQTAETVPHGCPRAFLMLARPPPISIVGPERDASSLQFVDSERKLVPLANGDRLEVQLELCSGCSGFQAGQRPHAPGGVPGRRRASRTGHQPGAIPPCATHPPEAAALPRYCVQMSTEHGGRQKKSGSYLANTHRLVKTKSKS